MRFSVLAVAAGLFAVSLHAHADLLGDTVNVTYAYPTTTTVYDNLGNIVVPGGTAIAGIASVVVNPGQIFITADAAQTFNPGTPGPNPFNGFEFTDLTGSPDITGASIDSTSSADVLGAALSVPDSNALYVDLEGLKVNAGDTLVLDLDFGSPASVTPEPSSIALLGTGLLGVAGVMRRRFVRA